MIISILFSSMDILIRMIAVMCDRFLSCLFVSIVFKFELIVVIKLQWNPYTFIPENISGLTKFLDFRVQTL